MAASSRLLALLRLTRLSLAIALPCFTVLACHAAPKVGGAAPESPRACEERQGRFIEFLKALPERSVVTAGFVDLPLTTLGVSPGTGPVLEVSPTKVVLDGRVVPESDPEERLQRVSRWFSERAHGTAGKSVLYVAASADLEIHTLRRYLATVPEGTELKLLVRTSAASATAGTKAKPEAFELAQALLAEQDPERRAARSLQAYREFSKCGVLDDAISASSAAPRDLRWPTRRKALLDASAKCQCSELDTESLQQIASAEQRAGAAGLGALPASFLRDHRCEASMARRSVGKLVKQMEAFDAEFAGDWQSDALKFEEVLANDRLLHFFCNALPGEALAALQRARGTLYLRPPGVAACQAWRFEPLAPGAPMGTLRRAAGSSQPPLAFHYWQAAEEIRLFGPVPQDTPTKPTDSRDWPCEQKLRLVSVDARSIETDTTRWYLDERTCLAAPPKDEPPSCVSAAAVSVAP